MNPADFAILRQQVKRDEGLRLFPYVDTVGQITIGWGRNLSANGISQAEAADMLDQDLMRHMSDLLRAFPYVADLDATRQIVLGNMAFNLGVPRLSQFVQMWDAIQRGEFARAAGEMLASKWAAQAGERATRLAESMASGEFT